MAQVIPSRFECFRARKIEHADPVEQAKLRAVHTVRLTGKTKPTENAPHPMKSATTLHYVCVCGHDGWSCHVELARLARSAQLVTLDEIVWEGSDGWRSCLTCDTVTMFDVVGEMEVCRVCSQTRIGVPGETRI